MSKYKPRTSIICPDCNDEIYSHFSGHYNSCSCGKCFVDETEHYCRHGEFGSVGVVDERNFIWTTADGKKIKVADLELEHAKNILVHIENCVKEDNETYKNYGRCDTQFELPYMYYAIKSVHNL